MPQRHSAWVPDTGDSGRLRPRRRCRTGRPLAVAALAVTLAAAPGVAAAAVKVTRTPPAVTHSTFDPATPPPPKMPKRAPGEDAVTVSGFAAQTKIRTLPTTRRLPGGEYRTSVLVDSVQMELKLTVDVWVPTDASEKLVAHEEGHRQISERVYAEVADRAARIAGDSLDGRRFAGEGATAAEAEKAANDALTAAHQAMIQSYLDETNAAALKVQEEYDALTRHGTVLELSEADAIARAWAKHPPRLWVPPKPNPGTKPTSRPAAKPAAPAPAKR